MKTARLSSVFFRIKNTILVCLLRLIVCRNSRYTKNAFLNLKNLTYVSVFNTSNHFTGKPVCQKKIEKLVVLRYNEAHHLINDKGNSDTLIHKIENIQSQGLHSRGGGIKMLLAG